MANQQHIAWLLEGVGSWNARREEDDFRPDFEGADLGEADLRGADLREANLEGADLTGANLRGADLWEANLREADLEGADLRVANVGGANLRGADLRGANLEGADIWEADLRSTDLREANVGGADLKRSNVRTQVYSGTGTNDGSVPKYSDLSTTVSLTQKQLDTMDGDSGTILPEGLQRPAHWPELELKPKPDSDDPIKPDSPTEPGFSPFVFLSYATADRPRVGVLRDILLAEGLEVWWDQDIDGGDRWREEIRIKLDAAACVVTLWTEASTASDAVREEAARAQSAGKLVHARLDAAPLPYGFSETQYVDLAEWDGSAEHPAMRRLIQAVRAKLGLAPELPDRPEPQVVTETDGKLRLGETRLPNRSDLEVIHSDLREDVLTLNASGAFGNISKVFDTMFRRFVGICDTDYADLDQVRFGVHATALRKRFDSQRPEIAEIAPEKIGDLEAILLSAELLAARLPVWRDFLAETHDTRAAVEEKTDETDAALAGAAEAIEADPAHFDAPLAARLREYWETKTTEAYLAAIRLLNDTAFVVAREVQKFAKDTQTEARKLAVKGMAGALVGGLGSILGKLAGIVPAELDWLLPWLEYIPTLLK